MSQAEQETGKGAVMNSIVLELQHDAMSSGLRVSDLLRKALVVARKLGISDFKE